MLNFAVRPIGTIHSSFQQARGTPIQSALSDGAEGQVEVFLEFLPGLKHLEGFERIWLIYWFDRAAECRLEVTPYLDRNSHGVFSTRAPSRPNPIGISPVKLIKIDRNILHIADVDVLDNTPLLDIKPYVPKFDHFSVRKCGWLDGASSRRRSADDRFENK